MNDVIIKLGLESNMLNYVDNETPRYYFLSGNADENDLQKFAELIVHQCGYYADVFSALGCPVDMDPTETKPSDYIKREMGVSE